MGSSNAVPSAKRHRGNYPVPVPGSVLLVVGSAGNLTRNLNVMGFAPESEISEGISMECISMNKALKASLLAMID